MNTARMHRSGVIKSRHYTRNNMNTVGGVTTCLYCRVFEEKCRMEVGVLVLHMGFHEKNQSLIKIC
jgi:hypothetical protein